MSDLKTEPAPRRETPEVASPPPGWFVLDVMRTETGKWDWVALMIDVDPEELRRRRPWRHPQDCWVRIPGKHRSRDAAWERIEDMMATRH
jgi:hypothetical protein